MKKPVFVNPWNAVLQEIEDVYKERDSLRLQLEAVNDLGGMLRKAEKERAYYESLYLKEVAETRRLSQRLRDYGLEMKIACRRAKAAEACLQRIHDAVVEE